MDSLSLFFTFPLHAPHLWPSVHTIDDNHMLQEKGSDHPEVGDIEDTGARKPLGPLTNQAVTTKRKHSADDEDIGKNWRQVSVFLYLSLFISFLLGCVSSCLFVFMSVDFLSLFYEQFVLVFILIMLISEILIF